MEDKHSFFASLTAEIDLSDHDFEFILQNASNHYDATVRSTVQVGGFLYGANNRRKFSKGENKTVELTPRELGLVLKSIEFNGSDQGVFLCRRLYRIAMEMQEKAKELNEALKRDTDEKTNP